jgi:hypothetical protein
MSHLDQIMAGGTPIVEIVIELLRVPGLKIGPQVEFWHLFFKKIKVAED